MTYEIRANSQYNSNEVYFSGKPSEATRNALKALKMRWNGVKKCWYGFADEFKLIDAIQDAEQQDGGEGATVVTDGYMGGGAIYGSKSNKALYGADLAAAIRADIKAAGIKGVTIRAGIATYTDTITATITIETSDLNQNYEYSTDQLLKELANWGVWDGERRVYWGELDPDKHGIRTESPEFEALKKKAGRAALDRFAHNIDINQFHLTAENYPELTAACLSKLQAVKSIIDAYHWDESNSMVDYFSTNFYYTLKGKPGKSLKA